MKKVLTAVSTFFVLWDILSYITPDRQPCGHGRIYKSDPPPNPPPQAGDFGRRKRLRGCSPECRIVLRIQLIRTVDKP